MNSLVPTAGQRTGNFAGLKQLIDPYTQQPIPNNQIPASQVSPQTLFFLNYFPLANTTAGTYVQSATSQNNSNQFDTRLDYQLRSSDLLTYTFAMQKGDVYNPGPFPLNGATFGPSQGEFTNLGWTQDFGPTLVNQAHVSYARYSGFQTGQGIGTNYTVQAGIGGFELTSIAYPGPPQLTVNGYSSINGYAFYPLPQTYNHYNAGDILRRPRENIPSRSAETCDGTPGSTPMAPAAAARSHLPGYTQVTPGQIISLGCPFKGSGHSRAMSSAFTNVTRMHSFRTRGR